MVQKSTHPHKGYLFDDTPRGMLELLLATGGMMAVLSAGPVVFAALAGVGYYIQAKDRARRRKVESAFQYLKRNKYVKVSTIGKNVRLQLTSAGQRRAKFHHARKLLVPVKRPPVWDKKWRLILFDIPADERRKRNALRGLVRRLGAVMLQKSVWVYPYDCTEQVALLMDLFDLSSEELRLVIADSIGDASKYRKHFKV